MKRLLIIILFLFCASTAQAQGHQCRMLFSADDPVDLVYDTALHTWAVERIYPDAEMYGWIGHSLLDLGAPDSVPYADGAVYRQDYGEYSVIWMPGGQGPETVNYDPIDIDDMWPLGVDGWGDSVTSLAFSPGVGIIVSTVQLKKMNYDVNGDGNIDPIDVVYLLNCVYLNRRCK